MTCKVIRNLCSTQLMSVLPHVLNEKLQTHNRINVGEACKPPLKILPQKRTKNARTKKTKLEI